MLLFKLAVVQLREKERDSANARFWLSVRFLNWAMHCCFLEKFTMRRYSTNGAKQSTCRGGPVGLKMKEY